MSKQSEAKVAQNYRTTPDTFSNCTHYTCEVVKKSYDGWQGRMEWSEERGRRCALGGFAVGKTAVCDKHEVKA